ncbi:MAG TPA: long-chain fatty acid--CoA ligase [Microbacteriaceae bacterium]|nr:long-chain fatty acid--CoA ligase [Microbacteriaceae bacterium]
MGPDGIGGWIRRRAVKSRGRTAIVYRDREITYEELADRIDRLASALRERGVEPGERVAYLGNNHPSFVETMFATARLGAIFLPLNTRLSIPELEFQLADSGATLLVSDASLEVQACGAAAGAGCARIVIADPDPGPHPGAADYETLIAGAPPLDASARTGLDEAAMILYTSGTTGRPKGAILSHGNLTWNAINAIVDYDVTSRTRQLLISPLFHVASLGMGLLPAFLKGATVLLQERFVPGESLAAIERLGATAISGVPTTYQLMMEDPAWPATDISSLESMTCGGSPVPQKVVDAYAERGLAFSGGYGMTETSPGVVAMPAWHAGDHPGAAGLAHFFSDYRIRGTDGDLVATAGERGEIEVSGPNVFLGYWGRDEATREAFTDDGWLRTGDVGMSDEDGFLTIADRLKDMIISGGENIYPAEVEHAIAAIDGVTGVAVIGVPDARWGEVPYAVVTLAPGRELTTEELVATLRERLAGYKIPRRMSVVEEFPRTASGKVRKAALRERYA